MVPERHSYHFKTHHRFLCFLACKFSNTGQTWGKILKTFATSSVIPDVADAFEAGEEDSVAYKIAVFCGAFGREHLLGDTTKYN